MRLFSVLTWSIDFRISESTADVFQVILTLESFTEQTKDTLVPYATVWLRGSFTISESKMDKKLSRTQRKNSSDRVNSFFIR